MKKIILYAFMLVLLGSCSHGSKENKVPTEEYDEAEAYHHDDESYNDVRYYF